MQGLHNIRVIDFSSWIGGPYVSKLFADAGADVIKVEASDGDPMRRWSRSNASSISRKGDSAFFQYLNASKRSVQGLPGDAQIVQLIEDADLIIEDFNADSPAFDQLNIKDLCRRFPQLVVLSISPFGRTGAYATRPATEFTIQAEAGSIAQRGIPTKAPYMAGGRVTDFIGGTYAAVAALTAVRCAQASGQGEHVDFSLMEVMNLAASIYLDLMWSFMGRPELPGPFRSVEIPSIEPTKDGWVGFNTNSRQQYDDFLLLIERPDLLGDEELASVWTRQLRMDEWNSVVREWTMQHNTADIIKKAALLRIPVAPVNNGQTMLDHEQFKVRAVFEKNPAGDFLQPRPPYRINGERVRTLSAAPTLGEHNNRIETRPREPSARVRVPSASIKEPSAVANGQLPLKGIRVLDATSWWAGPSATHMLATLGADVIHLESIQRLDGARTVVGYTEAEDWWEWSALFNGTNTNKRSLTLDLSKPKGLTLVKQLISHCDIIVENFSPRVFETFGLDWQTIHKLNPAALFVRMPAFGLDGPWRDYVGFAQTMEQMTGLAWLTGHDDDQPRIQRGPCDPLAGMHAAFATLVGLAERDNTGIGQFIECTMVEGALNAAAEQVIEYTAHGNIPKREGNRSPYAAPQGLYACKGEENWLALSIETEQQWQALVDMLDRPAWAFDSEMNPKFTSLTQRRVAQDAIDAELAVWAKEQELTNLVESLVAKGIPAATLLDGRFAYLHPQLSARGFFETVQHCAPGPHPTPTVPFRFASRENAKWVQRPAPTLGQHNREILADILGLNEEEIAELQAQEIIGTKPKGL